MDNSELLEDLAALLESKGVEIRRQAMGGGGGGLCRIKEKNVFFVDTECSVIEMIAICAKEVNRIVDTEAVYIKPQLREVLEKYA